MQVGLLGPIELRPTPERVLAPRGYRQRLLLASLLLHAPRALASARLIDILWGDALPDDPGAALRTQISRLRRFLAGAGAADRLQRSESAGCRLHIEAGELDTDRFATLHRRARESTAPERGLVLADEALALWRDTPFGEFSAHPLFLAEVARLTELRTALAEHRVTCLLALGRTAEALGSAERLIDDEPLRERPRALCM
jgi:DNA-binding SARP family transcriptional activator